MADRRGLQRVRQYGRATAAVLLCLALVLAGLPAQAQTPTPPWPTPIVTEDYIVRQEVTYGDGGIILGLLFVGGVLLLGMFVRVSERVTDR